MKYQVRWKACLAKHCAHVGHSLVSSHAQDSGGMRQDDMSSDSNHTCVGEDSNREEMMRLEMLVLE